MRLTQLLVMGLILIVSEVTFADGVFMVVKGDVKIAVKGKAPVPAKVGMKVNAPDKIIAGKDARAKIVMSDKNILNISPNSEIVVESYKTQAANGTKDVSLNVIYGKVRATVNEKYDGDKSKFQVKTPSAVAGVRGTDFLTEHNRSNNQSKVIAFEGTVTVGSPNSPGEVKFISAGEMTVASKNAGPSDPIKVPPQELQAMNKESSTDGGKRPDASSDRGVANEKEQEKKEEKKEKPSENKEGEKKQDKGAKQEEKKPEGDKKASNDKKPEAEKKPEADKKSEKAPEKTAEKKPEAEKKADPGVSKKPETEKKAESTKSPTSENKSADKNSPPADKGSEEKGSNNGSKPTAGATPAPGSGAKPVAGTPPSGGTSSGGNSGSTPNNSVGDNNRSPAANTNAPGPAPGGGAPAGEAPPVAGANPPPSIPTGPAPTIPAAGPCLTCDILAGPPPPTNIPDLNFYQPPEIYQPPQLPPDLINTNTNLTVIINVQ